MNTSGRGRANLTASLNGGKLFYRECDRIDPLCTPQALLFRDAAPLLAIIIIHICIFIPHHATQNNRWEPARAGSRALGTATSTLRRLLQPQYLRLRAERPA
jgi:hypothetical protein